MAHDVLSLLAGYLMTEEMLLVLLGPENIKPRHPLSPPLSYYTTRYALSKSCGGRDGFSWDGRVREQPVPEKQPGGWHGWRYSSKNPFPLLTPRQLPARRL